MGLEGVEAGWQAAHAEDLDEAYSRLGLRSARPGCAKPKPTSADSRRSEQARQRGVVVALVGVQISWVALCLRGHRPRPGRVVHGLMFSS